MTEVTNMYGETIKVGDKVAPRYEGLGLPAFEVMEIFPCGGTTHPGYSGSTGSFVVSGMSEDGRMWHLFDFRVELVQ